MKRAPAKTIAWLLIVAGVLIVIFSPKIVFPCLERLVGIETIVGHKNVFYEPDGSYFFTNPRAMVQWISAVAFVGFLMSTTGIVLLMRIRRS